MRTDDTECRAQTCGQKRSQHPARGKGTANPRSIGQNQLRGKRKYEKGEANELSDRGAEFLAEEPAPSEKEQANREEKRCIAEALKKEIGGVRANGANPVVSRAVGRRRGGDVERRVLRGIRKQAQGQQSGKRHSHKADQLVDSAILGWFEYAHVNLPGW